MAEHYILCVLSQVNVERAEEKDYSLKRVGKPTLLFRGYQTNEAPVQCLIQLAMEADVPVTGVICLVSGACNKTLTTADGNTFTAKEHFRDTIAQFYRQMGLTGEANPASQSGFFKDVAYDGTNPSANLQRVIEILDRDDALIDIDTTGGPRDAAFLLTNVVQFIEAKYRASKSSDSVHSCGLGTTVYTNLFTKEIYLQSQTFEISKLIYAIGALTEFGKAEPLNAYFNAAAISQQDRELVQELGGAIQAFADDLSLCRTKDIALNINCIHSSLTDFEERMHARMDRYDRLNARLDDLRSGRASTDVEVLKQEISGILEPNNKPKKVPSTDSRWAALQGFKPSGIDSELDACETVDSIADYLSNKIYQTKINRGLILFLTFTDTLRKGIPAPLKANAKDSEQAQQMVGIIRWCTERGMLQQSLALFKERVPECLEQFGMIDWGTYPPQDRGRKTAREQKVARLVQLSSFSMRKDSQSTNSDDGNPYVLQDDAVKQALRKMSRVYKRNEGRYPLPYDLDQVCKWRVLCLAKPSLATNEAFIRVKDEEHLPAALAWYYMLGIVRNSVMHVDEEDDSRIETYLTACSYFFKDTTAITCTYYETGSPKGLKEDLFRALQSVEGEVILELKEPLARALNEVVPNNRAKPCWTVEDIRKKLSDESCRMLVLGNGGPWVDLNGQIQLAKDLQIVKALKVVKSTVEDIALGTGDDAKTALDAARRTVLACAKVGDYVLLEDVKDMSPFNDERSMECIRQVRGRGSVFAKIARAYPGTFQLATCVVPKY